MVREDYMRLALSLAREAFVFGEVPVGCVVVKNDGTILGRGRNRCEEGPSALAHAELEAIGQACRALGDWRLTDARIFVTMEPCPMCAGAIINARIKEVCFGAKDPLGGACGSVLNLFEEDFRHHPRVFGGILEEESRRLLQSFFRCRREASSF